MQVWLSAERDISYRTPSNGQQKKTTICDETVQHEKMYHM